MGDLNNQELSLQELILIIEELPNCFLEKIRKIEFEKLVNEFQVIQIPQVKLTSKFHIGLRSFLSVLIANKDQSKVNFCLVSENDNLSMMIHFSNNEQPDTINTNEDTIYLLKKGDENLYLLDQKANQTYKTMREAYDNGLGCSISEVTRITNTQIIIFDFGDISCYFKRLVKDLESQHVDKIKYLCFDMIKFKEIPDSEHAQHYKENKDKISFGVCVVYQLENKAIKRTDSYNLGNIRP